jgi:hypothetical protein
MISNVLKNYELLEYFRYYCSSCIWEDSVYESEKVIINNNREVDSKENIKPLLELIQRSIVKHFGTNVYIKNKTFLVKQMVPY